MTTKNTRQYQYTVPHEGEDTLYTWACTAAQCKCLDPEDMFPGHACDCVVLRDGIRPVRCAKCMRKLSTFSIDPE